MGKDRRTMGERQVQAGMQAHGESPEDSGKSRKDVQQPVVPEKARESDAVEKELTKRLDSPSEPPGDMAVKRMSGELEVSVTWDRTHRFFPGLRTMITFRMVG
ncbi:hypothetical protein NM688_g5820 [Phlebia brevispora]|uniref:Uncharacterized protein n=1 Tax=Phlebia brevispora TaxID=194682 RepID=A0ACC1SPD4_9APHY|nr:hypothetical protein NM688_g5820 [Phlebia brevispora]